MSDSHRPGAFVLRDLMVLVAILGLAFAVIAWGVHGVGCRGGRRAECLNNMRQIGLAMLNFANQRNRFPNAVTFGERPGSARQTAQINARTLMVVYADDPTNPTGHDLGPLHSWVVDILPGLDWQSLYNDFNRGRVFFSALGQELSSKEQDTNPPQITNSIVGNVSIRMLVCPNDDTVVVGAGNLSYAVNVGFVRWAWVPDPGNPDVVVGTSWDASPTGGQPNRFTWGTGGYSVAKKTGLMFVGTIDGDAPWDMHHSLATIRDGTSTTLMLAENVLGGASDGTSPYGWTLNGQPVPTNWATAHPNFVGFMASSEVCGSGADVDCSRATDLSPTPDGKDGAGWASANRKGSFAAINYGAKNNTDQGGSPFANSLHPGGLNVVMCDGSAKWVAETIDGSIWARLITPDGQTLPQAFRQNPINWSTLGDDLAGD